MEKVLGLDPFDLPNEDTLFEYQMFLKDHAKTFQSRSLTYYPPVDS
jgi:hypothetical protein